MLYICSRKRPLKGEKAKVKRKGIQYEKDYFDDDSNDGVDMC